MRIQTTKGVVHERFGHISTRCACSYVFSCMLRASRTFAAQVMQMFEKAEAEYGELRRKKEMVENDKHKIQEVRPPRILLTPRVSQGCCEAHAGCASACMVRRVSQGSHHAKFGQLHSSRWARMLHKRIHDACARSSIPLSS